MSTVVQKLVKPEYHQLEFDLRLWLTQVEVMGQGPWGVTG